MKVSLTRMVGSRFSANWKPRLTEPMTHAFAQSRSMILHFFLFFLGFTF
jgi:hypothetical protein